MRKFRPATIRGRLVAVLIVSLSAVLVLLGVLVARELDAYRDAEHTTDDVDLAVNIQAMVHELQRERGLTNGLLAGRTDFVDPLAEQRRRTDEALVRFAEATSGIDSAQLRTARARWTRLPDTRAAVDGRQAQRAPTFAYFTDGIAELVLAGAAPERTRDRELLRGLNALAALGDAKEAAAQSRGFLNGVLSAGRFTNTEYQAFAEIRAAQQVALGRFQRSATPPQQARGDAALRSQAATSAQQIEQVALAAADGRPLTGQAPAVWWASMTTVIDDLWNVQLTIDREVRERADELRSEAADRLLLYVLVAILLVAGEIVLTVIAVRSITRPLTLLAKDAEAMASVGLPEVVTRLRAGDHGLAPPAPVDVPAAAGREILAVAAAFGRVQDTAVQLAAEQAVLRRNTTDSLVNLARRNQNLVRRQLGFISRLEHEESDPTALGNLFELDHLATRMRRNAESLLVLVGEAGQRPSSAPLHITDVVRGALSEVEDYRRVVLRRMDETGVAGTVVTELAHLLAELVENALAFSPPDVEVEIYGRRIGNDYLVAVIDHGVGMTAADLETANARLSGQIDFLDAPSRSLGHHVVGRLARRLGADVRVGESPVTGVTARVLLPAAVLADVTRPPVPPGPVAAPVSAPVAAAVAAPPALEAVPPPPPPFDASPAASSGGRTRNGLTKRVRRHAADPAPTPPPASLDAPAAEPRSERSPHDVRGMLTSFRSGHLRGEIAEFTGVSAQPPYPAGAWTAPPPEHPYPQREEDPA